MTERPFRSLTDSEIAELRSRGSSADSWTNVRVAEDFAPDRVAGCTFSGQIRLGAFRAAVELDGVGLPSGLYDSRLHEVTVGDDALVQSVGLLSHYDVGSGVCLFRCDRIGTDELSAFGGGRRIAVFNEGGGREVTLYDRLSAPVAYLLACYRHRPRLIAAMEAMIVRHVEAGRSRRGHIGTGARMIGCGTIRNAAIGPAAVLEGVTRLEDATVVSSAQAPTRVGAGVQAQRVVIQAGSTVDGAAMLTDCFVGQACRIGRQFSAEGSAFFANSECFHGEACSLLAGPYTVSHHKSSLLIGGLFSFFNAGSGTNQSNHMYKLGPVHQGILERGSKTGSSSYLLWPARVGAFTAVIGKHYTNFDTRSLPFSYIDEVDGRSVLSPALNLFTVGTRRDGAKWPSRDRRAESDRMDPIHFDVFSPLTIGNLLEGLAEIGALYDKTPREQEYVSYKGISIKRLFCRTARKHYEIALKVYLGGLLVERLEAADEIVEAVAAPPEHTPGPGRWVDLLGLLAPQSEVETLCEDIEAGRVSDVASVEECLRTLHESYPRYEWSWAQQIFRTRTGKTPQQMSGGELSAIITDWRDASVKLNNMILNDAGKEFVAPTRIGFGIDGDAQTAESDFAAIRGTFEDNTFVQQLQADSAEVTRRSETLLNRLGANR